jgi:hypothetical protein
MFITPDVVAKTGDKEGKAKSPDDAFHDDGVHILNRMIFSESCSIPRR